MRVICHCRELLCRLQRLARGYVRIADMLVLCGHYFPAIASPSFRFALASICAFWLPDRLPLLNCCDARAFAFAACARSGIGYFRSPGSPKVPDERPLRRAVLSLA